jgi:uncharacterized protein (DUF2235 family)
MAIDEKRTFFPVLQWDADKRVTQRWFSGVHCDVGGGYGECGLSDITLQWMIDHACEHGLLFKESAVKKLNQNCEGTLHDSYDGIWIPFGTNQRIIAASDYVHTSTRDRMEKVADYRPANLPANPNFEI